ncbi:hypothetical protein KI387_014900, partial [Taxus chinensis]
PIPEILLILTNAYLDSSVPSRTNEKMDFYDEVEEDPGFDVEDVVVDVEEDAEED